jgi:hypothetical protein
MKKALPLVLLLVAILAVAMIAFLSRSGPGSAPNGAQAAARTLPQGTPVHAILLDRLQSGGTAVDSDVLLLVSEDVSVDGAVVISKGSPIRAKVTQSREEGSLGALTNSPARLSVSFSSAVANGGQPVSLSGAADRDAPYEFNRANTGIVGDAAGLDRIASDDRSRTALDTVRQIFENPDQANLSDPETKQGLRQIATSLGMTETSRLIDRNEIDHVSSLISQLRQGSTIAAIASGGATAEIAAALELANLAGKLGSRLSRMAKGRNIVAYVGTPVTAYVTQPVRVGTP